MAAPQQEFVMSLPRAADRQCARRGPAASAVGGIGAGEQRCLGGEVAAQFATAGLIDEMIVTYTPCSLGGGSPVLPIRSEWTPVEAGVNGDFVCAVGSP